MHILFFIHSLSAGGAERVTATLANHWVERGWRVSIVTITGPEKDFYALHQGIARIVLRLDVDSANVGQAVINNLRRVRALRRVLREERPDVAVAMMATANCLLAWAGRGSTVLTVGSERIYPPTLPLGRAWERLRRWSYPYLDALVAQTDSSADWLRTHSPARRIEVIPNPVVYPLASYEPRVFVDSLLPPPPSRRLLLAVGRLDCQKGFDRLLTAFAVLSKQQPMWVLVILGEGPQRRALKHETERLSISGKVFLPGTVGNVGDWFQAADLYVLTSRFEGFPNTLMEALAYGLPAVAVDCETGPRDILRHEVDGLLVPQNDAKALVKALKRLMADEDLRARYAERAVEARQRFAVERVAGMWEEVFTWRVEGE